MRDLTRVGTVEFLQELMREDTTAREDPLQAILKRSAERDVIRVALTAALIEIAAARPAWAKAMQGKWLEGARATAVPTGWQ